MLTYSLHLELLQPAPFNILWRDNREIHGLRENSRHGQKELEEQVQVGNKHAREENNLDGDG